MSLNLIHHTSINEIKVGMEILLENNQQVSFEALRNLILGERRPPPVNEISLQHNQVPLKPDLKNYDTLLNL